MDRFAEVIVDVQNRAVDRPFHYFIPEKMREQLQPGHRVVVPFGSQKVIGYVLRLLTESDVEKVRPIQDIVDEEPLITGELLKLAVWVAEHTCSRLIDVLRCIIPPGLHIKGEKVAVLVDDLDTVEAIAAPLAHKAPKQAAFLRYLVNAGGEASVAESLQAVGCSSAVLTSLSAKGHVVVRYRWTDPAVRPKTVQRCMLAVTRTEAEEWVIRHKKSAPKQAAVMEELLQSAGETLTASELARRVQTTPSTVKILEEKNLLCRQPVVVWRNPAKRKYPPSFPQEPTPEQARALREIEEALRAARHQVFLLRGVTGSGKTEVYLQAIEKTIELQKQAIMLVPEISLTPQTVRQFKARFGDRVAVLHSRLAAGERFDEWRRVRSGEADVVVGARSAVFAPLTRLGLIIIDEEHEQSYKQDEPPRYHARDVARQRALMNNSVLLLGSATPALESMYLAEKGVYSQSVLSHRIDNKKLPTVYIVDMRKELKRGNRSILSRRLKVAIAARLEKKEQIIILLNRRGYATCVLCRECGLVMKCTNCRVTLTYHDSDQTVRCHYCGLSRPLPRACPRCRSRYLRQFGVGTQRVEEVLLREFPGVRILRMDADTTQRKGSHAAILECFGKGEADILVGTQMIAKGLHFPAVTLVGVITADTALNLPDFRAAERTFQLLTQVAGRAGRGEQSGEVVIQTYAPHHYSIRAAAAQDYEKFYWQELMFRRRIGYPPFRFLARILVSGPGETDVINVANEVARHLEVAQSQSCPPDVAEAAAQILGPAPAPLSKVKNRYRWHILIKGEEDAVRGLIHWLVPMLDRKGDVSVSVDVMPYSLL